ncbi:MAG: metal-sulfur cluster assembly factor [Deltaproteobacteria bacterium]|nr:metal-sulfur cluster assembly factor [Deltaproteobacteria bacterium]
MVDKETVLDALKRVYDPEIPVDVVNLGLVYEVVMDGGRVDVTMTTTAVGCPVGNYIAAQAEQAIRNIPGVTEVHVEIVHEPPWHEKMISQEGRRMLGWRT